MDRQNIPTILQDIVPLALGPLPIWKSKKKEKQGKGTADRTLTLVDWLLISQAMDNNLKIVST